MVQSSHVSTNVFGLQHIFRGKFNNKIIAHRHAKCQNCFRKIKHFCPQMSLKISTNSWRDELMYRTFIECCKTLDFFTPSNNKYSILQEQTKQNKQYDRSTNKGQVFRYCILRRGIGSVHGLSRGMWSQDDGDGGQVWKPVWVL